MKKISVVYVSKKKIMKIVKSKIKSANIILDIGSGIKPQSLIKPKIHICVDVYNEYIEYLRKYYPNRNLVLLRSDWKKIINIFPDKSIDTIFLLDFLEHLDKEDGEVLLKKCENIAKKQIVVFTPLEFFPQIYVEGRKDRWGMNGSYWQQHKSGWNIEDFDETWDITCVKEYHYDNGYGHIFDSPFGVIWAIKNIQWDNDISPRKLLFFLKKLIPQRIKSILKKVYKNYIKLKEKS